MPILNADLHCHSVVSDGTLEPEELAARAAANGVELWALTDHDEIGGQHRAAAAAHAHGMQYLTGTEISVTFADETVHIVGLGFDAGRSAACSAGLERHARRPRPARAARWPTGWRKVGITDAYEGALKYVGNPGADLAHPLRALPGRGRRVQGHPRGVPHATSPKASPATCRTAGPR